MTLIDNTMYIYRQHSFFIGTFCYHKLASTPFLYGKSKRKYYDYHPSKVIFIHISYIKSNQQIS